MKPLVAVVPVILAASLGAAPASAQSLPDRPVSRAEVAAAVDRQFARIDADHDGVVTAAEFARFRASAAGRAAAASDDPFVHVGGHWLDHADPDGTGRVTRAMARAHPLAMFDMADADRDGVLSVAELRAAQALRSLTGR